MEPELQPQNFLGLPEELSSYERSRVVVLPAPYDSTTSYRAGARLGPAALLDASRQVELWDDELLRDTSEIGVYTSPPLYPVMSGPEDMCRAIETVTRRFLADGKFVFLLGGEHSVTVGAARATREQHGEIGFLQIDAHADLRDQYEGTPYNHACVMRRLIDLGPIVQVGIRNCSREEHDLLRARGLRPFWARDIAAASDDAWMDEAVARLPEQVYVTVDLDGLDPSILPATGTPEPGGLGWYQTLRLLRKVGERRRIVGCDINELSPIPGHHASEFLAARLAYKMIGYFVRP